MVIAGADARGPSLRTQLVHAVIGSAGVRVAGMAVTFLIGVQLARFLGPADYGVYGSIIAITSILAVVAQAGLPQLLTREMSTAATNGEKKAKGALVYFAGFILVASCILAGLLLLVIALAPGLVSALPRDALLFGLVLVPATALVTLATAGLRGLHRAIDAQFQDALLRPALFALLLFGVGHFAGASMDARRAVILQVVSAVIALLIAVASVVLHLPRALRDAPAQREGRRWAISAVPMAGTELLRIIDGQLPILLLGVLVTLSEVGLYRVAFAIAAFVGLPATLLNLVVMSHVAQLHGEGDKVRLRKVVSAAALVSFVSSIAATFGLVLFGRQAIGLIFGPSFVPAWEPLCVISVAWCVNAFVACAATMLNMCGKEHALALTYMSGTVIGILLLLLLTPAFGTMGAAISLLCAEVFRSAALWLIARRSLGIDCSLFSALADFHPGAWRLARVPKG